MRIFAIDGSMTQQNREASLNGFKNASPQPMDSTHRLEQKKLQVI
jgi:superfamily II DNA/RNA helicase